MDPLGLDKLKKETLPELLVIGEQLIADLNAIVSRLDGATITITINLKGEQNEKSNPDLPVAPCHVTSTVGTDTNRSNT